MKNIITLLLLFIVTTSRAQQITGKWYSGDSSRIYEIKERSSNTYEAVVTASKRAHDSIGFSAIKALHYNKRKKRYEGFMYSTTSNKPCYVKISLRSTQLVLKLNRLFLFDTSLKWNKVGNENIVSITH
jgi:hypothetical protein